MIEPEVFDGALAELTGFNCVFDQDLPPEVLFSDIAQAQFGLPGMANSCYVQRVKQRLRICFTEVNIMFERGGDQKLHFRKLCSYLEPLSCQQKGYLLWTWSQ
ncbi:MAG: hypothetical protein CMM54_10070 [Rhodospirillaceae bacterium]|nr:hypothetical protein [Rhodospirillaceae bacterium]|tara:strand:+ start:945 stop:1253 length:309 start_codon:yes stop_codon:yes gene_type:complete